MAENLFLRLNDAREDDAGPYHVEWMSLDRASGIIRSRGEGDLASLSEIASDLIPSGDVCVMLSAEDVLLTQAAIPSRQMRQILQAVPYMVEENLATDIDQCHFSVGRRDDDGNIPVAIIESEKLSSCLTLLREAGIAPDIMTIDVLAVPYKDGCTVMVDGDRVLFRNGQSLGFANRTALLGTVAQLLSDSDRADLSLMVHQSQLEAINLIVSQLNAEQEDPVDVTTLEFGGFETLCREFNFDAINLLQGDFKVEAAKSNKNRSWRSVAILAVCAFVLHIAVLTGQGIYLGMQADKFENQARSLYAEIYPNDRNVRDIRRRWKAHLGQVGDGSDGGFLPMFADTAKHLPGSELVLNNINFNESRGDLVLQLEADKSEQLIQFSQTLEKLDMNAEIGTINQGEDSVKGSIRIKSLGDS